MPKKNRQKISQSNLAKLLEKIGIPLEEQRITFSAQSQINVSINEIINNFGDIKTNINLIDLLSPSSKTRAKEIPRPQNAFLLFRKNFSKGLGICDLSMSVADSSRFASKFWQSISTYEKLFWFNLSNITKNIHRKNYPNYKFIPYKDKVLDIEFNEQEYMNDSLSVIDDQSKINEVINPTDSNKASSVINEPLIPTSNDDIINTQLMELDEYSFNALNIDINSFQYNSDDLYLLPTFMNDVNYYDINSFQYNSDDLYLLPYNSFIDPHFINYEK